MLTQSQAIIEAFQQLKGVRSIDGIKNWVGKKYGDVWRDFATPMADMVPPSLGGNHSSNTPQEFRVLERVSRGMYRLRK